MIKCHVQRRRRSRVWVKASGSLDELVPEACVVIALVYSAIHKKNPEAAKEFRNRIIGLLLDPESPVWKEG